MGRTAIVTSKVKPPVRAGLRYLAEQRGTTISSILAELAEREVRREFVAQLGGNREAGEPAQRAR